MSVYSNCIYSPFALVIVVVETPSIVSYFVEHFWSFIINKLIQWFDLLCKIRRAEQAKEFLSVSEFITTLCIGLLNIPLLSICRKQAAGMDYTIACIKNRLNPVTMVSHFPLFT